VCQGTVASDERIRVQSFTCLHEIAANYYGKLPPYMQEIFNLTVKAIKEDNEEVSLQAVEFWSTLCDYELELEEEGEEAEEVRQGARIGRGGGVVRDGRGGGTAVCGAGASVRVRSC
jgi:hypothetical protein